MSNATVLDVYAFPNNIIVSVTQIPRRADIVFQAEGKLHNLRFDDPKPLAAIMSIFNFCCNIRVIDLNVENNGCLEFGRFRVEPWSEDDLVSDFIVDNFEYWDATNE